MKNLLNKIKGFILLFKFDNTLDLILSRIFRRKHGLNVYRIKGLEIIIDHAGGDENGTRAWIVSDMYRKYLARLPRAMPINLLDLGANGGGFILLLQMIGFRLRKIVALEMNPYTYSRMYFNVVHNVNGKHILRNEAISGKAKTYSIRFGRGSTSDSLYNTEGEGDAKEIRGRTLDDIYNDYFCGETIHICKIDVEGAEFEVFEKLPTVALSAIEYIIMEIHGDSNKTESLLKKLENANFMVLNRNSVSDNVYFLKNASIDEIPLIDG